MYCGIDPGNKGALAFADKDLNILAVVDMPTLKDPDTKKTAIDGVAVSNLLKQYNITSAALELTHAMPGNGVSAMYSFGMGNGVLIGIMQALGINITKIRPKKWQQYFLNGDKSSKELLAKICTKYYPNISLTGVRGGLKDGRSDALLLLRYFTTFQKLDTAA